MVDEFDNALDQVVSRKARALVLAGDGQDFCHGGDIIPWENPEPGEWAAQLEDSPTSSIDSSIFLFRLSDIIFAAKSATGDPIDTATRTRVAEQSLFHDERRPYETTGIGGDRVRSCPPHSLIWTVMALSVLARMESMSSRRMTRLRSRIGVSGLAQSVGKSAARAVTASRWGALSGPASPLWARS
jgi:hypothetical protein